MKEVIQGAKTKEEALRKAMAKLNASEAEIIYSIQEEKGKLFKGATYNITATTLTNAVEEIIEFLKKVIENLGLTVSFESSIREKKILIRMFADNNGILIGKEGQTLKALETLAKQKILNDYNTSLTLDVEDYKEKRIKNIEYLAKKTAEEVRCTKVAATLENMNSFERRVVHNILSNFKGIKTISEGEEPLRHVVIKPIDE